MLFRSGVGAQPRKLIQKIKGIQFIEMKDSDRCCGFGGSFGIKYPEISTAMLEDKVANIRDSGAEIVLGGDMGCLMNIEGLLRRRGVPVKIMHIAQLIAHTAIRKDDRGRRRRDKK